MSFGPKGADCGNGKVFRSCFGIFTAFASPLCAGGYACPEGDITGLGAPVDRAGAICAATELATRQRASCNPEVSDGVTMAVTQSVPGDCHGMYHCHVELIQLQPLEAFESCLAAKSETPSGHLSQRVFFDSVLRH
ncbi:MAG: hypothetical protein HLUCCO18_04015 [Rhodobacteraceae bacterium HLUCCO18]|nr:MAG: hypothetical protein HLUCCO18_04015 [Rhodobacteraceae bacterium HLUCCO18]